MVRHLGTTALAFALTVIVAGCGGSGEPSAAKTPNTIGAGPPPVPAAPDTEPVLEPAPRWEPSDGEPLPNAKRLAAEFVRAATTYPVGSTAEQVAIAARDATGGPEAGLADRLRPLVHGDRASSGEVVYPQLAGDAGLTAGVMVLVRQTTLDHERRRRSVTRVIDVRLARDPGGPWRIAEIGGVGGTETERPGNLSTAARRALDHPRLFLSDSARWDIFRGEIDDALLRALADAADSRSLSVLVLRSGHPREVWATTRRSAHHAGRAADVYAVSGLLVVRQRQRDSSAFLAAQGLLSAGAAQVGSPWDFGIGRRSFTDLVHQDHLHVHWTPGVPQEG